MDYDLLRLGAREFEHLAQALCVAVFGPRVQVFGDGPDAGRDATVRGRIDWATVDDGQNANEWDGYTVVQVKFALRPGDPSANLRWLMDQLYKELSKWANKRQKHEKPDYLLIVTNVVLSPGEGGGIDSAHKMIAEMVAEFSLGLRSWRLWHYDTLCTLLDVHRSVRFTYGGFLTTGDVLAQMDEWLGRQQTKLGDALTLHAVKDMLGQQYVRLGQAGDPNEDQIPLYHIGVDLPALTTVWEKKRRVEGRVEVAAHIVGYGERVLDLTNPKEPPYLLLVGGPGEGKSTLTQMVCQCYRIALLDKASLTHGNRRLLDRFASHFNEIGLVPPTHLRWPFRVVLSDYSDWAVTGPTNSLLRYLAQKISFKSACDISGADLQEWLGSWPWVIVLDGMDEVVSPIAREKVSSGINEFLVEAAHQKADVLLVITTRPQGYLGEFGSEDYRQIRLLDLEGFEALSYARKLTSFRLKDDLDMREQVDNRITAASRAAETSRLMRSPLQITIMTLLLERRQRVPSDRYQLFNAYFETIYAREANKPTELGSFLEDYRKDIESIHETVALELQQQAELVTEHEGSLPAAELDKHAFERLRSEGNDDEKARTLARQIVRAATHRLVLLVPRGDNSVGFEIRSLQEYLAARALTRAEGPEVLTRLRRLIPSAHWRNTWLLAAGRLFAEREGLREQLISMLEQFDNDSLLSWLVRAGAQLATDLLADDLAIKSPQYRRLLANQALDRLNGLPDGTCDELASVLIRLSREDKLIEQKIDERISSAVTSDGGTWAHAMLIMHYFISHYEEFRPKAIPHLDRYNDYGLMEIINGPQAVQREVPDRGPTLIKYLTQYLPELADRDRTEIMRLFAALPDTNLRVVPRRGPEAPHLLLVKPSPVTDYKLLQDVLSVAPVADAYATLVNHLPPQHWHVAVYLRNVARAWYVRRVTGENL